jgi:hypothetical protein
MFCVLLLCFGESEVIITNFLYFFLTKNFFKKFNGIRFARSDDRSEVAMCMEWIKYKQYSLQNKI